MSFNTEWDPKAKPVKSASSIASEEEAALRYDQVAISLGKTILNFDRSARPWLGPIF